jgi:hypothetical protein
LDLLILALSVKALMVGATLALYGASPDPLTALGRLWNQWDAQHYLYLAMHGYSASGDARNLIAFFPLYPAVIAGVAAIGIPARVAALLISNISGVAAAILLFEIARLDLDEGSAFRAAAFFTVFPTAYFLLVGYTEALFCVLAFAAVLLARRNRWLGSGMLVGLAGATRLTGLALGAMLAVEAFGRTRRLARWRQPVVAGVLASLGLVAYLATNQLVLGNAFAFLAVQRQHWHHQPAPPWTGLATAIRSIGKRPPWETLTVGGGEIAGGLTAYAATVVSWLRLRPADAVYATVLTVMVTFVPFWLSIPRYLLTMFPLFLLLGGIRRRAMFLPMLAVSLISLLVFGLAFARGYWAF